MIDNIDSEERSASLPISIVKGGSHDLCCHFLSVKNVE